MVRTLLGTPLGRQLSIQDLKGADAVSSLLRRGDGSDFTEVWRLSLETRLDLVGELQRFLVLDLARDRTLDDSPLLRLEMSGPREVVISDDSQLFGLTVDDISMLGWEGLRYRVYANEDCDFDVTCLDVTLSLQPKFADDPRA